MHAALTLALLTLAASEPATPEAMPSAPVAPSGPSSPPVPPPAPSVADSGFALAVQAQTHLATLGSSGSSILSLGGLQGGFFAGYKTGRVVVGVGIDVARYSVQPKTSSTSATTSLRFTPTFQIATLRSQDLRVELYLETGLGLGHVFTENATNQPSNILVDYRVGPGLRYWVHPQLAISALAALSGEFGIYGSTSGSYDNGYTTGSTSILAGLQFLGVF